MAGVISVAVADDHVATRAGVAALLAMHPDIHVVAQAASVAELERAIASICPDVVVSDILFGDEPDGLALAERLGRRADAPPVLLYSSFDSPAFAARAVAAGAAGYQLKSAPGEVLATAVRALAAGGTAFPASLLRSARTAPHPPTPREVQIIEGVANGQANAVIGHRLGISDKTVESHLGRLFTRYGLESRTELALHAVRQGWIRAGVGR